MNGIPDYHPLLRNYVTVLRFLGLWKISKKSSNVKLFFYYIYKFIVLSMICIFIAALAADLCDSRDNLIIITDDGCILAGLSVILFKLINFQIYINKLDKLLDFINDNIKILREEGNPEYLKIWKTHILRERITIYSFGTIGTCLIFALMFFTPINESGELPIRSKYPFDVKYSPIHQTMFIFQGIVLIISMTSILAMDNIVITFCSQTFCHFEILKRNFAKCNSMITEEEEEEEEEEEISNGKNEMCNKIKIKKLTRKNFIQNFTICVKRHQEIIQFVDNLDEFFSPLMLVQLMASNILICLTGFQAILVVGDRSNSFIKFAVYLSAAFSQLFYWCWCGNELIYQSTSIAEVLWLCPWEIEIITSIKSLVTIPLMRVKKPLKLTAGKFYVMSMETFISVLSGSYSFFTLLNKMNESTN